MAVVFDPLHKWLGIPPSEQPPNHYRLLGVTLFEADPDAVSNAADQRMALLRTFQMGEHATDSQRLLNEVVTAQRVLLSKEQKTQYDSQLRRDIQPPAPPAAKPSAPRRPLIQSVPLQRSVVAAPVATALPDFTAEQRSSGSLQRRRRDKSRSTSSTTLMAMIAAGVIAIVVGVWALNSQQSIAPTKTASTTAPAVGSIPKPGSAVQSPPSQQPNAEPKVEENAATIPNSNNKAADDTIDPEPVKPRSLPHAPKPDEAPLASPRAPIAPEQPRVFAIHTAPAKPAAPNAKDKKDGLRRVRELYKVELAAAASPNEKRELAMRLLRSARENPDDDPLRFALLEQAKELGVQAGKPAPIVAACNQLAEIYDLDAVELEQESLIRATKGNRTPGDHRELALAMRSAAEEAVVTDHFELAKRLAAAAHVSARKAKAMDLAKDVAGYIKQIDIIAKEAEKVRPARESLAADPGDTAANAAIGRLQCYFQGDWSRGLAHMERGGKSPAAELAHREKQTSPASAESLAVADAWWDLAVAETPIAQHKIQLHAGDLYWSARSQAGGGLTQTKVEHRLAEVVTFPDAPPRYKLATGWWRIAQEASGKFIAVSEGSHNAGHPLIVWDGSGAEQQWRFEFDGQGLARLINRNSGLALGIREGSDRPGMDGIQWYPGGYECRIERIAGETIRLVFRHGGLCADTRDGALIQSLPGETETQFWRLERAE